MRFELRGAKSKNVYEMGGCSKSSCIRTGRSLEVIFVHLLHLREGAIDVTFHSLYPKLSGPHAPFLFNLT